MKKRVGIINSGGDCPGLNAVINAIVRTLDNDYEVLGFIKGYEGLLDNDYRILDREYTGQYGWIGGTILKSVNKGRFPGKVGVGTMTKLEEEVLAKAYQNYSDLGLEALIILGGDGTLSTASQLQHFGFNVVGIPKSIDNDLDATDFSFGFQTALQIVNEALDRLHTTATSHDRIMILEVMGRMAGWIALYGGIAGNADVVLVPEIPFKYDNVVSFLKKREARGRTSGIIVVAEGAMAEDGEHVLKNQGGQSSEVLLGGIGEQLATYLNTNTTFEARSTSLGHVQRGGSPYVFDRVLSCQYGVFAAEMFRRKEYGHMVAFKNNQMISVPLDDAVAKLKVVEPEGQMVHLAQKMGIYFGN